MINKQSVRTSTSSTQRFFSLFISACVFSVFIMTFIEPNAFSVGFVSHHAYQKFSGKKLPAKILSTNLHNRKQAYKRHDLKCYKTKVTNKIENKKVYAPISAELIKHLRSQTIVPGVIYKTSRGALKLNILDIDPSRANILIKPIVAEGGRPRLQTVKEHAYSHNALAAINANYFKSNGTTLGTLIIDGEWIVGPLYDRVALGITRSGYMRMDRVGLGGMLFTSNEKAPKIWINNVNEPRRTGSHIIAYTKRWGNYVRLAYDGRLVAIDAQGKVVAFSEREMTIPNGGVVISDSKESILSSLQIGDTTNLQWQVTPGAWQDVAEAISGGPMLLKDGRFCLNLQAEKFHGNWTSNKIQARTACGITANNHLILATVEGPHTLFDLTNILRNLGAIDAMNLDGGGSTTMVIRNKTANIENKSQQRKVAAALGIFETNNKEETAYDSCQQTSAEELLDLVSDRTELPSAPTNNEEAVAIRKAL